MTEIPQAGFCICKRPGVTGTRLDAAGLNEQDVRHGSDGVGPFDVFGCFQVMLADLLWRVVGRGGKIRIAPRR